MKKGLEVSPSKPLIIKWKHTGSNRGPSACKADALNQLSYASFTAPFGLGCKYRQALSFLQNLSQKKILIIC